MIEIKRYWFWLMNEEVVLDALENDLNYVETYKKF